MAERKKTNI